MKACDEGVREIVRFFNNTTVRARVLKKTKSVRY